MDLAAAFSWFKDKLTILKWLPDYTKKDLSADVKAGITVGVILIPQAMAYAVIAGLSPIYGLYGSLIPLLIYPLFGTSKHLAIGVVATDMIIIASGASLIAEPGTDEYVSVVILLAMLAGLTLMIFSMLRLGFLANLLSKPLIYGFMASAPLIIGFSQLGNLLGIEIGRSQYIGVITMDVVDKIGAVDLVSLGIGIGGILFLITLKKLFPLFPRALVLLGAGGIAVWALNMEQAGLEVVGPIPSGLPSFSLPDFSIEDARRLLPTVTTLVLIQLMSVISMGKTFANKYKYPLNPNREFFALGMAGFIGSFFQSPPVSASFSRTAVNEQAGVQTSLSNVVSALIIGFTLLLLTPLFYFIPIPALAAIIIVASISLIDVKEIEYFFRTKPDDAYIAIFTFLSVLIIGIQEGILLGIGASLVVVIYRSSRPNLAVLGHLGGSRNFRDISKHNTASTIEEILILRFDTSIAFNNAEVIKDFIIQEIEVRDKKVRAIIIDAKSINDLDTTGIDIFRSVIETLHDWKIELHFAGLKTPIRSLLLRSGLARKLGGTHFHESTHRAVKYLLNKWDEIDENQNNQDDDEKNEDKKPESPTRFSDYMKSVD
jgi:SulP family sulfate permease